jgi:hypothetical protein
VLFWTNLPPFRFDVHFPTTDGRTLILSRYTHPEPDPKILLEQLNLWPNRQLRPKALESELNT